MGNASRLEHCCKLSSHLPRGHTAGHSGTEEGTSCEEQGKAFPSISSEHIGTDTRTSPYFPRKMEYKGSCAVSLLGRGKCMCVTSFQVLVLKEDTETEPLSHVLDEEGWG